MQVLLGVGASLSRVRRLMEAQRLERGGLTKRKRKKKEIKYLPGERNANWQIKHAAPLLSFQQFQDKKKSEPNGEPKRWCKPHTCAKQEGTCAACSSAGNSSPESTAIGFPHPFPAQELLDVPRMSCLQRWGMSCCRSSVPRIPAAGMVCTESQLAPVCAVRNGFPQP